MQLEIRMHITYLPDMLKLSTIRISQRNIDMIWDKCVELKQLGGLINHKRAFIRKIKTFTSQLVAPMQNN